VKKINNCLCTTSLLKVTITQMSVMFRNRMRVCTTPEIVMLQCCGWWWQQCVQNMTGIGNSFIKKLVICSFT